MFSNKTYNYLKWFSLVFMPALTAFVGTVGLTLSWEFTDITVVIMTAFSTFLGATLGISNSRYNKEQEGE